MEFINIVVDIFTLPLYALFFLVLGKFFYGDLRKSFEDPYLSAFLEIVLGLILTIASYALLKTSGKSIMLLLLLLLGFQYGFLRIRPDLHWYRKIYKTDLKAIALLFGCALVVLLIQFYRHDYFNPDLVKLGWEDYGFYSDVAESFNTYGIEKTGGWYNYFNSETLAYSSNPVPYHYFELWTQALFLNTSLNHGVFVFIYMFTPFACGLASLGFYVLGRTLLKTTVLYRTPLLLMLALLMPFFMGKLPFLLGGFKDNIVHHPRNYMFYILFIGFVLIYRRGYKTMAVYCLAMLSCVNILYLPTVSSVLVLLAAFQYFKNKKYKRRTLHTLFAAVFPAFFVIVFYFVLFKKDGGGGMDMTVFNDTKAYLIEGLTYYFRLQLARVWFFYLPIFLLTAGYLWKTRRTLTKKPDVLDIILLVVGMELVSLVFASFIPHLEAGTFNSIVLNPMLAIASFMGLMYAINTIKALFSKLVAALLTFQLIYGLTFVLFDLEGPSYIGRLSFSKTFLQEVYQLEIENKVGVFYKKWEGRDQNPFSAKSNLSYYSAIFDVKDNGFFQVDLSTYIREDRIPFKSIKDTEMNTPMFKYGSAELAVRPEMSRALIDRGFIKDYNIEYIICNPGAILPDYLKPLTKQIIKDNASKVQLVLLK